MESTSNPYEITEDCHFTSVSLHRCQVLVSKQYNKILILIGWRPFMKINQTHETLWACLNYIYVGIIVLLLCYSYTYDALYDTEKYFIQQIHKTNSLKSTTSDKIKKQNSLIVTTPIHPTSMNASETFHNSSQESMVNTNNFTDVHALISAYIIPATIHFAVYIYGFIHFRIKKNEQIDAVMEKVFLRTQSTFGIQKRLVSAARWYLIISVIWVFINLIIKIISMCILGFPELNISKLEYKEIWIKIFLITVQYIGKLLACCVYIAVIVNYATQCEFFIHSIQCLCLQLQEKTLYLKDAMQEIVSIKQSLSMLNSPLSRMTSLCVLNLIIFFALGIHAIMTSDTINYRLWIFYATYQLITISMFLFPLIQAARVTKTAEKLLQISLHMRVFGYKNSLNNDLDSFIIFVGNAKLRGKLYSISIKPAYLVGSFAIVILFLILYY